MKKFVKIIIGIICFKWFFDAREECVKAEVCDYSGQGRDRFGR